MDRRECPELAQPVRRRVAVLRSSRNRSPIQRGRRYRYHPYDEPDVGREAVVAGWLGEGESDDASTRDDPGTYEAEYSPVAIDGDTVVATGTSRYRDVPDGPVVRTYDNCFVMRFDGEGRCREFTEYYIRRP